jgi:hypothetical protein
MPWTVGWRAQHFGRTKLGVAGFAAATLAAVAVLYIGLLGLAFNGYMEDAGTGAAHTLGTAIPVIAGAVIALGALFYASGTQKR